MALQTLAVLCDENGRTFLGSDGYLRVDGRFTRQNQVKQVRTYREKFKQNFPHKYEQWTHVMFVTSLDDLTRRTPYRWQL